MWLSIKGMFVWWILVWISKVVVVDCGCMISLFVIVYIGYCYGFVFILVIYRVLDLCRILCICVWVDGDFNGWFYVYVGCNCIFWWNFRWLWVVWVWKRVSRLSSLLVFFCCRNILNWVISWLFWSDEVFVCCSVWIC